MKMCLIIFSFFFFSVNSVQARNIETFVNEVRLNSASKTEAQNKALRELSVSLVKEMLGLERFKEEKQKITNQIIKNQIRYILSVKSSRPLFQDEGDFLSTVTIQVSRENLKNLLIENNLYYRLQSSICLLPLVAFSKSFSGDEKSYLWWMEKHETDQVLQDTAVGFFNDLDKEFIKQGFYVLNPVFQKLYEGTPQIFLPKKGFSLRDFAPLSRFYDCDIILSGSVKFGEIYKRNPGFKRFFFFFESEEKKEDSSLQYFTDFFFNVFNIRTRQFLFKLKKQFSFSGESDYDPKKEMAVHLKGILDSLVYQLSFYQKEGFLDLRRLIISVQGPLNYFQKEKLKKDLVQNISGLEDLKKIFLTSNRIVYEARSSKTMEAIAEELKKTSLSDFIIQIKGHTQSNLEIYAARKP